MTANELKELRARLGLTQKGMAEQLGLTWRHYQRLEAGTTPVNKRTALACQALEVAARVART